MVLPFLYTALPYILADPPAVSFAIFCSYPVPASFLILMAEAVTIYVPGMNPSAVVF
jgi:hypothetical protein